MLTAHDMMMALYTLLLYFFCLTKCIYDTILN